MLWDLFWTFLLIGAVSFGGGYSMIPVIEREVVWNHGWMSLQTFSDVIAISGMAPGPMATNSAVFIGYKTAGIPGSIVAALGTVLPSLTVILIFGTLFYKVHESMVIKKGFYGLRPIITGLIFYAAISFALGNRVIPTTWGAVNWEAAGMVLIAVLSFVALFRFRVHPVMVILSAGVAGSVLFS